MAEAKSLAPANDAKTPAVIQDQFDRQGLTSWAGHLMERDDKILKLGRLVILLVVVLGGIWGSTMKIGGAVISPGRVIAEDRNRVIQHLEGGILKSINVREGDFVTEGQVVAELDDTRSGPELANLRVQRAILQAQLLRRRAEVMLSQTLEYPADFGGKVADHPRVLEAVASQKAEFDASRAAMLAELEVLDTRISARRKDIVAYGEMIDALQDQNALYKKELADFQELLVKGLIRRTQVYATERKVSEMNAQIAVRELDRRQASNDIDGLESEKRQVQLNYVKDANRLVVELQRDLNTMDESMGRLEDSVNRAKVKAPVDGTVFRINARTLGGVIKPADPIMEIFPRNDNLTVESYVPVKDIEQVYKGQKVRAIFPSNRENPMQPVNGEVTYVSPDAVVSEKSPEGTYIVHVSIDPDQTIQEIVPGNVAEVYFVTEPKTFFGYMVEPITRFAFRAFKG
ncbi:HlyD family type I secretion periplasmic adaptor subunit [Pseudokordiimonas caeni]|uniref:HlyD family type I secretion periplasmic adaptor subunit n=1 Tax=Pseudokordiimonas caeni TaxID=2997908 RepID=UPI0028121386|nr:HlyD family type I secretion periplasmic adaptor subunit [Pseudokordiimonas caeni]